MYISYRIQCNKRSDLFMTPNEPGPNETLRVRGSAMHEALSIDPRSHLFHLANIMHYRKSLYFRWI